MSDTPFKVYVIATRPFVEKAYGVGYCDGAFWLDRGSAERFAEKLNEELGIDSWKVYPAHIIVNPDEDQTA